jgi:hypothetical protein
LICAVTTTECGKCIEDRWTTGRFLAADVCAPICEGAAGSMTDEEGMLSCEGQVGEERHFLDGG